MPVKSKSRQEEALFDLRYRLRHSAAHVMAGAVIQLFPEAKIAIGPPTEDGFYYDFEVAKPFTVEDLEKIETLMRESIAADSPFEISEISRDEANDTFIDQPFKQELITSIPEDEPITTYRHGQFLDLCEGPHVSSTGDIAAIKLLSVAGAYWRGEERNPMLQRIYGTAWEAQESLDKHLERLEAAANRDHRKLGRDLDLFSTSDSIGPGLIIWHPKGARNRAFIKYICGNQPVRGGYD